MVKQLGAGSGLGVKKESTYETNPVSSSEEDDQVGAFITSSNIKSKPTSTQRRNQMLDVSIKTNQYIPEVLPGSFDEKSNPLKSFQSTIVAQRQQKTEVRTTEFNSAVKKV